MKFVTGGTSFGFLNGATLGHANNSNYKPIINSYDYEAPITESGGYTEKYFVIKNMISERNKIFTRLPAIPKEKPLVIYSSLKATGRILLTKFIDNITIKIESRDVLSMENLPINNASGQQFGYIVYKKTGLFLYAGSMLKIPGYISDTIFVLINGKLISKVPQSKNDTNGFGFWKSINSSIILTSKILTNASLELVVENFGRSSQGTLAQKGLFSPLYINDRQVFDWTIIPLEFKNFTYQKSLQDWTIGQNTTATAAFYKFILKLDRQPLLDTYLDMREWNKGIVIVNGFVLSRYFFLGPQLSSYLPASMLKKGENNIIVFEHYTAPNLLKFSDVPLWSWNK